MEILATALSQRWPELRASRVAGRSDNWIVVQTRLVHATDLSDQYGRLATPRSS